MPAHAPWQALLARGQGREVVTVLGVTGHQDHPRSRPRYDGRCHQDIFGRAESPLTAVTSLAAGADQLFATELLRNGGHLHVIVPSRNYERTFATDKDLALSDRCWKRLDTVTRLDYEEPSEAAFLAAGKVHRGQLRDADRDLGWEARQRTRWDG